MLRKSSGFKLRVYQKFFLFFSVFKLKVESGPKKISKGRGTNWLSCRWLGRADSLVIVTVFFKRQ